MSKLHVDLLGHLANIEYLVNQIHARGEVHDDMGIPLPYHMEKAREEAARSMSASLGGDGEESVKSLGQAYSRANHVVDHLHNNLLEQLKATGTGNFNPVSMTQNIKDVDAVNQYHIKLGTTATDITHYELNKAQNKIDQNNKKLEELEEKKKFYKEANDNAREVVDNIADENNLNLPGSWDRHRDEPSPNGE
jgi:hypothetical protein